jgi:ubiquinone/menaquinone biosynthesis C-methylase UbiE
MMDQKEFWEDKSVLKRRPPEHPVIEAFARPKVDEIVRLVERDAPSQGMTLLDVGSGNGYFSHHLKRRFDVTALDFSRKILSICPIEKKVQAAAERVPFRDGAFDVVFAANLLHHAPEPVDIIDEMLRVCSRYVVLVEPNRLNPFMFLISQVSRTDRSILRFSSGYMRGLVKGKAELLLAQTTGFILPNVTPLSVLPLLKALEPFLFPKMFHLLVARKLA